MRKFLILVLLITLAGCAPKTTVSDETQSRLEEVVQTIYSACNTPMNWEEIPKDGLKVAAVNYPNKYVYNISVDGTDVYIKHIITGVQADPVHVKPYPQYTVVPLLYTVENKLAWSGLMLIQEREGKMYLERSLTVMSEKQLVPTIEALEDLLELLEKLQSA